MPGGISYNQMAPASAKALEREAQAKELFLVAKEEFEKNVLPSLSMDDSHTVQLLPPDVHLTSHTYSTFNKWIKSGAHPGWKLKRREATKEECKEHRAFNKGKSYWVDAIYTVPDPEKDAKRKMASEKRAAKKQKLNEERKKLKEERNKPPLYKTSGPFQFEQLHESLQLQILAYAADVPTLNALTRTSKTIQQQVDSDDTFWEPNLRSMLHTLFDGALGNCEHVTPLSKRPFQSTQFRGWVQEMLAAQGGITRVHKSSLNPFLRREEDSNGDNFETEDRRDYPWMFEHVSAKDYYKNAGKLAADADIEEKEEHFEMAEQTNRCPYCMRKQWDCRCGRRVVLSSGRIGRLPRIRLFRAAQNFHAW